MLWFVTHQIVKLIPFMSRETKNLTVFLTGVWLYAIVYSYIGSSVFDKDSFIARFCMCFTYLVVADAFSMGVIYKNYFGETIFKEVKETFGVKEQKPIYTEPIVINHNETVNSIELDENNYDSESMKEE
jgi:hypothetical protein